MDLFTITSIKPDALATVVLIVAISSVGLTEYVKNYLKKGARYYSLLITLGCALMNSTLISPNATALFDIFALGVAVTQCAYQVIVQGIPRAIKWMLDKVVQSGTSPKLAGTE